MGSVESTGKCDQVLEVQCELALKKAGNEVKRGISLGGTPPPELTQMLTMMGLDIDEE